MEDKLVVIPLGTITLAFTPDEYERGRQRGREFTAQHNGKPAQESEKIVTAEEAADLTKIPASWFLEAARQGRIPSIQAGKYRRFRLSEVLKALEAR